MKNIKQLFLPYELSAIAKEKGFNEPDMFFWSIGAEDFKQVLWSNQYSRGNSIDAPLYQQILDWFREKHRIDIDISCDYERETWWFGFRKKGCAYNKDYSMKFKSYYEALDKAIEESFKLI